MLNVLVGVDNEMLGFETIVPIASFMDTVTLETPPNPVSKFSLA